ncbi:MAG: hypothetical protein HGB28_06750 [Oscillochloris sp.]|nr:hypothetical protein [Oscillochloris sp.]
MGLTIGILVIALVSEVAFTAYCLATSSHQIRLRSWIRIGMLAGFALASLVSVIWWWTFRWYLLIALLAFWAALGAWRLYRGQPAPKAFVPWRTLLGAAARLLLIVIVLIPALLLPQFTLPPPTGTYAVASATYTYTDTSRVETFTDTGAYRMVNVGCWYPLAADGTYPLVVFSHGTGGIKISNTSTFMDLASNGYVVCSIDHPYHSQFTIGADGKLVRMNQAYWQEYLSVATHQVDAATKYQLTQKWLRLRAADMNFVLDTILAQANDPGAAEVYRLIDPARVGVMGHSIGGAEGGQVARERDDISAVVNLDGDLDGEYVAFVDGNEVLNAQPYPVPILNIFSDDLARALDATPNVSEVIAAEHVLRTAPHGYDVRLPGTNHFSVTDLPLVSPFFVWLMRSSVPAVGGAQADPYATIEQMNGIVLDFFDAYLKGVGSFSYLEGSRP